MYAWKRLPSFPSSRPVPWSWTKQTPRLCRSTTNPVSQLQITIMELNRISIVDVRSFSYPFGPPEPSCSGLSHAITAAEPLQTWSQQPAPRCAEGAAFRFQFKLWFNLFKQSPSRILSRKPKASENYVSDLTNTHISLQKGKSSSSFLSFTNAQCLAESSPTLNIQKGFGSTKLNCSASSADMESVLWRNPWIFWWFLSKLIFILGAGCSNAAFSINLPDGLDTPVPAGQRDHLENTWGQWPLRVRSFPPFFPKCPTGHLLFYCKSVPGGI